MNLALLLVAVPALIAVNAFFVAAEYALVRARLDRIEALEEEGASGARLAHLHIDQYIAACQVGVTMASLGLGAVGEPAFANLFEDWFGGVLAHGAAVVISV